MKLEHVAIWTKQLDELKDFYVKYFAATPNDKYRSDKDFKGHFESYFLTCDSGARLELMRLPSVPDGINANGHEAIGLTHIAFSVDTKEDVDALAARFRADGIALVSPPRMTGDGYYECCALDPDGNRVEVTTIP